MPNVLPQQASEVWKKLWTHNIEIKLAAAILTLFFWLLAHGKL